MANPGQHVSHYMPKMLLQNGRGAGTNAVSKVVLEAWEGAASIKHNQVLLGKGLSK